MALKFLNKKGWHTGSLRNLENVWKAEQKHEAEQKKLEELKVQIHKEREAEELRQQYQAAGLAPKQDRLEFLYDSGVGASSSKPADDYNFQRAAVEVKSESNAAKPGEKIAAATPGALFSPETNVVSANDKWRKIHSDPLYLIKQQELAALERIRKNPVKMEMLANQVKQKMKPGKDRDEDDEGKHRKKSIKDQKSSKKRDKKGEKDGKGKKGSRSGKHRKRKHRDDSSDSGYSDSDSDARPTKKHDTDERLERRSQRDGRYAEKIGREVGIANNVDERVEGRTEKEDRYAGDINSREGGQVKNVDVRDEHMRSYRSESQIEAREEDQRGRERGVGDRFTSEYGSGDKAGVKYGRRSNHYDQDDRSSKRYDSEGRSSMEFDRFKSLKDHHLVDNHREVAGRGDKRIRSSSRYDRSPRRHDRRI